MAHARVPFSNPHSIAWALPHVSVSGAAHPDAVAEDHPGPRQPASGGSR
jgi:hypothetical protein